MATHVSEVVVTPRAEGAARVSQVIDYIFYIVYSLLFIRLALGLIAARSTNQFVQFIRDVTDPFYLPFRGIVPSVTSEEGFTLVVPILVAIVVYAILHGAIHGLLRMVAVRQTTI
jgi:uncharacterized protein YggT (Ycf19 family)